MGADDTVSTLLVFADTLRRAGASASLQPSLSETWVSVETELWLFLQNSVDGAGEGVLA